MIALIAIAIILVTIPVLIGLTLTIAYQTAKAGRQLTFRRTGEIQFIWTGDEESGKIVGVIMDAHNTKGVRVTHDWEKDEIVEDPDQGKRKLGWWGRLLKKLFPRQFDQFKNEGAGFAYVSVLYPIKRLAQWELDCPMLECAGGGTQGGERLDDKYQIRHDRRTVRSLSYTGIYPVLARKIELTGGFMVNVLIQVTLTIRKPVYILGNLKASYLTQAMSEASGLLDNELRSRTLESWQRDDRASMVKKLVGKGLLTGAVEITDASYVDFDYDGNTAQVIEDITAARRAFEKGKAEVAASAENIEKSKNDAKSLLIAAEAKKQAEILDGEAKKQNKILEAEAEQRRLELLFAQCEKYRFGPDVYMAELKSDAIKSFKSTGTLVLGSEKGVVMTIPTTKGPSTESAKEGGAS